MSPPSRANTKFKTGEKYVVEKQPYPNIPVYVVYPTHREVYSQTLHRNYLLPINNNLEQAECDNPVEEVGAINEPIQAPQVDNVLMVDRPTESQPKSISNSVPEQHKLVNLELTGLTGLASSDPMNDMHKVEDTTPVPLWWSSRKTRNQLPLRYWDFAVWQNHTPPGTKDWWVGLCICLYIL